MANKAYIRIHNDIHIDYLVLDADGESILSGSAFHEDQLPEFPSDVDVSLIVPGTEVLLLTQTMPKTSRAQCEKALPYALEEQLIEDVDNLHFVASKQDADGNLVVLVVKKQLLHTWIEKCATLGLYPQRAIPDYLAITAIPDSWHLYLEGDNAVLRQAQLQGLSIEHTQLHEILALNLPQGEDVPSQAIEIDYDDANEYFEVESLADLKVTATMAAGDTFCMQMFAQGLTQTPELNLLSGEFLVQKPKSRKRILWKVVAVVLFAWVMVWLVTTVSEYFVYQSRLQTATNKVTQLYKQAFPNAQTVVSPRLRIQRALHGAQAQGGGIFLSMLTQVGQQIKQKAAAVTILTISFRNKTLTLNVSADNFQTLANLSAALQSKGLTVRQQNASSAGKKVNAQLVVTGAANG